MQRRVNLILLFIVVDVSVIRRVDSLRITRRMESTNLAPEIESTDAAMKIESTDAAMQIESTNYSGSDQNGPLDNEMRKVRDLCLLLQGLVDKPTLAQSITMPAEIRYKRKRASNTEKVFYPSPEELLKLLNDQELTVERVKDLYLVLAGQIIHEFVEKFWNKFLFPAVQQPHDAQTQRKFEHDLWERKEYMTSGKVSLLNSKKENEIEWVHVVPSGIRNQEKIRNAVMDLLWKGWILQRSPDKFFENRDFDSVMAIEDRFSRLIDDCRRTVLGTMFAQVDADNFVKELAAAKPASFDDLFSRFEQAHPQAKQMEMWKDYLVLRSTLDHITMHGTGKHVYDNAKLGPVATLMNVFVSLDKK